VADVEHPVGAVDPDDSPFAPAPTEGIPYEKGSDEDLAIERILERARERDLQAVVEP
jgi:hypothetical protein